MFQQPLFHRSEDDELGEDGSLEVVIDFEAIADLRLGPSPRTKLFLRPLAVGPRCLDAERGFDQEEIKRLREGARLEDLAASAGHCCLRADEERHVGSELGA